MSDCRIATMPDVGELKSVTVRALRRILEQVEDQDSLVVFMGENTDELRQSDLMVFPFVLTAECKDFVICLGQEAVQPVVEHFGPVVKSSEVVSPPPPPVDRTSVTTTDGRPLDQRPETNSPDGQHSNYLVLSAEERSKGFVRPYRDAYRHLTCGAITTMGRSLSETYARDPKFYGATYCQKCQAHFPVGEDGEFTWYEMDGTEGPKVGT